MARNESNIIHFVQHEIRCQLATANTFSAKKDWPNGSAHSIHTGTPDQRKETERSKKSRNQTCR